MTGHTRRTKAGESERWVLRICFVGLFSSTFTITIFAVALDVVARDLHSTTSTVAWAITGPFLAWAVATPVLGRLGDLYGHRRLFLLGLAGSAVFACGAALAWNAASLIVFRTLAQLASSAMIPASVAILFRVNPPHRRLHAVAWAFAAMSAAAAAGLVVGGFALDTVGWRALIAAQAGLAALVVLPAVLLLPADRNRESVKIDVPGAILLCFSVSLLAFAANRAPLWGVLHPLVIGSLVVLPLAAGLFVVVERRAAEPLVPLSLVARRNVAVPLAAVFCSQFAYMGGFVVTPLFLQRAIGYSAAAAALVTLSRTLSLALASPGSGRLAWRFGERSTGIAAAAGVALGSTAVLIAAKLSSVGLVIVGLCLIGAASAAQAPATLGLMTDATGDEHVGLVSSIDQMLGSIGGVIGMGVLTAVVGRHADTSTFTTAFAIALLVAISGLVLAFLVGPTRRAPHTHDRLAPLPYAA